MTVQLDSLPNDLQLRWQRHQADLQILRRRERQNAQDTADQLLKYPGYYFAAVARNQELLSQYADRPNLHWIPERWAQIFEKGGFSQVLAMLADEQGEQELLSSSPFYLMRPPLPENHFYQDYAPTQP
ncbi:MAG: hypothetical protein NTV80_16305 [Verrucomicrobia bacterium]|nr:hypothetical protein [Verrucomicrobiota bacterium]